MVQEVGGSSWDNEQCEQLFQPVNPTKYKKSGRKN